MFFGGLTIATNGFSMFLDFATITFNGFRWFRTIGQTMRWFRWIVVVYIGILGQFLKRRGGWWSYMRRKVRMLNVWDVSKCP